MDSPAVATQLTAVGQMLIGQQRMEDALKEFRAAVDRMPSDPVIQTNLALALSRARRWSCRDHGPCEGVVVGGRREAR